MLRKWLPRALFAASLASLLALAQLNVAQKRWYKGNLHTHTLNSDGDSTPDQVTTWYREHKYNFLTLSDHNFMTEVGGLNAVHGAKEKFLLIPGEEVTDAYDKKPIHMNSYNPAAMAIPQHGTSVADTIQNNTAEILKANGLPSLNHPNFGWAVTAKDLLSVRNLSMFEVYNGHPMVNNDGGGGFQSLDEMWDVLLTAGQRIYGIAVDDAHHFKTIGKEYSNPGHGWVQVRAAELTPTAISTALAQGDFYASSGVTLSEVSTAGSEYKLTVEGADWEKITTYFIGEGGKVLAKSFDRKPVYKFTGQERYVRARVESSSGSKAWAQPVFLAR